jgi:hypothetical protein
MAMLSVPVYCVLAVRDSLVVGEAKPKFRNDAAKEKTIGLMRKKPTHNRCGAGIGT